VYQEQLDKAVAFLKQMQWTTGALGPKGERIEGEKSSWYGGWGYNNHGRPDLSNAQFSIQALHDSGLKPDDPAFQAAICFLQRTQNSSATNDQPWAGDDGGFIYSPADGGDSEATSYTGPDGQKRWRSYGSMTYAGLKSMIYAGLSKDDRRVQAAVNWARAHWTLDENPGMKDNEPGQARHGLYYYLYVFAHALHAYGEPIITDEQGVKHDWRAEFVTKVTALQNPDGSWSGEKRWMEDNPVLVTAYIVLALEEVRDSSW
jgi:squalene-hopene/tetraprenyl-beta-curcumene cyclase